MTSNTSWPADVLTLAIDIGGSGFKAAMLDPQGAMLSERVRVDTPYPVTPEKFVTTVAELVKPLGVANRVSVGFPGLVRDGKVIEVPSLSRREYGGERDEDLANGWYKFDLRGALAKAFGLPTILANDADIQGCAVAKGDGFEFVMTLGTGVGTALFNDGKLLPHLELSHGPFKKHLSFDIGLGNAHRKEIGNKDWAKLVRQAIADFHEMLYFDHIYIGGGNAKHLSPDDIGPKGIIVPNTAGITGGVKIWEMSTEAT